MIYQDCGWRERGPVQTGLSYTDEVGFTLQSLNRSAWTKSSETPAAAVKRAQRLKVIARCFIGRRITEIGWQCINGVRAFGFRKPWLREPANPYGGFGITTQRLLPTTQVFTGVWEEKAGDLIFCHPIGLSWTSMHCDGIRCNRGGCLSKRLHRMS
jgi:hypothetical protein